MYICIIYIYIHTYVCIKIIIYIYYRRYGNISNNMEKYRMNFFQDFAPRGYSPGVRAKRIGIIIFPNVMAPAT